MGYILDNIVAIGAAALAAFLWGGLYYRVLRAPYLAALGPNAARAERRPGWLHYGFIFAAEFWMACILAGAVILAPAEAGAWTMAIGSAVVIWCGFVLPVLFVSYRLAGLRGALIAIDAAHWLGAMVIIAATVRAIGVTGPG